MYKSRNVFQKLARRKSETKLSGCTSAQRVNDNGTKPQQYKPLKDLFALQKRKWDALFDGTFSENQSSSCPTATNSKTASEEAAVSVEASKFVANSSSNEECCIDVDSNLSSEVEIVCNEPDPNVHDTSLDDFLNGDDTFEKIGEQELVTTQSSNNLSPTKSPSLASSSTTTTYPVRTSPTSTESVAYGNKGIVSPSKFAPNSSPYYVENLKMIIKMTVNDTFFADLLDDEDRNSIDLFLYKLSIPQQKLFTRLYLRKFRWLRLDQISYNDLNENLKDLLDSLVQLELIDDVAKITNLKEALQCLLAPDLKCLCRYLKLDVSSPKNGLMNLILNHCKRNSIGNFFIKSNNSSIEDAVLTRAKSLLGRCYRLNKIKRSTFMRVLILSSLSNTVSDDDLSAQQMIFQMLQTSNGLVRYPEYSISRTTKVFQSKEDLIMYENILEHESNFWHKMENKDYEEALQLYYDIRNKFHDFSLNNERVTTYNSQLPSHLKYYTTSSAYIRILNKAVSLHQFLKQYEAANQLLYELLSQPVYHLDYRGRWFDRITLNLDFHLKKHAEALLYIEQSLNDPWVKMGHRLDLLIRGKKILSSKNKKHARTSEENVHKMLSEDPMNALQHAPDVTIIGYQLPKTYASEPSMWLLNKWSSDDNYDKDDNVIASGRVEQVALNHYASAGYPEGIHGEGITLTTLFMLISWDIVYMSITDVFYNNFQTVPLDFRSHDFYEKRKEKFDERYQWIADASEEEVDDLVEKCWNENHGVVCPWINWELFTRVDHVKGLIKSLGQCKLSNILRRMAQFMRFVTGGVPDLLVWNPVTRRAKFVEVKGPGDKLSSKQILWLNFLLTIGVEAEVCHVKAENPKKLAK